MNKYEIRRQNLILLKDKFCGRSIAKLADRLGKNPSYVSRLLYEEGKEYKKNIADRVTTDIENAFSLPMGSLDGFVDIIKSNENTDVPDNKINSSLSDIIKRLNQLMDETGLRKSDLKIITGVSAQGVNNWFKRDKISTDSAGKICLHTGYSLDWLMLGKFPKKIDDSHKLLENVNKFPHSGNENYLVRSIQSNKEFCDMANGFHENIIAIEFDKEYAKNVFDGLPSEKVTVSSFVPDTMEETIKKGSTVFLDINITKFIGAGIYMFAYKGFPHLNRLQMRGDKLLVISDNPKYGEWEIKIENINELIFAGRIVGYYPPFVRL